MLTLRMRAIAFHGCGIAVCLFLAIPGTARADVSPLPLDFPASTLRWPAGEPWACPSGYGALALDPDGSILLAQGGTIWRYSKVGDELARWTVSDAWAELATLEVSADGDIFALDWHNRRVHRFAPDGTLRRSWDLPPLSWHPDLAVDAELRVYVVHYDYDPATSSLLVFDGDGTLQDEWEVPGAYAVTTDGHGDVWVAGDRVLQLAPDGQILHELPIGMEDGPATGIGIDDGGTIYLHHTTYVSVRVPSGLVLARSGRTEGQPEAMAVASDGTMLIAECDGGSDITWISGFDPLLRGVAVASTPSGQFLSVDGVPHETPFYVSAPAGVPHTIAANPVGEPHRGVRHDFAAWSDGSVLPARTVLTSQFPQVLEATFTTKYRLTTTATPGGTVLPGTSWHTAGTAVEVEALPSMNSRFLQWTLAIPEVVRIACCVLERPCCNGQLIAENPTSILMDQPHEITASFVATAPAPEDRGPAEPAQAPAALLPPFPNPFGGSSVIAFDLPDEQPATVSIYDVTGRLVRVILQEEASHGSRSVRWDGRDGHGVRVARGTYFVRLQAGGETVSRKVVFLGD